MFRKHKIMNNSLWRYNAKDWVTKILFPEWIREAFCPIVRKYRENKVLPTKALIRDSAPAHLWDWKKRKLKNSHGSVKFLPPNITPLLHSMDQHVLANCKKLHTKELFLKCFQIVSDTDLKNSGRNIATSFLVWVSWEILSQSLSNNTESYLKESMV